MRDTRFDDLAISGRDLPASRQLLARNAEARGDYQLALDIWQQIDRCFGTTRDTLLGIGHALEKTGQVEEAERVLQTAIVRYPDDAEIAAKHALLPASRADWLTSATRWRGHLRRFPTLGLFEGVAATALAQAGMHQEAEEVLDQAVDQQGQSLTLRVDRAIIAELAGRWPDAVDRWDAALNLLPGNHAFRRHRETASLNLMLQRVLARQAGEASLAMQTRKPLEHFQRMAMCFTSLGDNCELGLVQRAFGAEPPDLFRFAAVQPEKMIDLLDQRFECLGDPDHTVLEIEEAEYVVSDDRGYFRMHSFVSPGQMTESKYLKRHDARIQLLRRTLMTHLQAGDHVCVCKQSKTAISDETLHHLSCKLRAIGDNLLLGIRPATPAHPAGSVFELADGILVGHLGRIFNNDNHSPDLESWACIIEKVHTSFQAKSRL